LEGGAVLNRHFRVRGGAGDFNIGDALLLRVGLLY
jgi:hypothetical protein